jgi:type IV secretory pathway VirB2 component (pilin)
MIGRKIRKLLYEAGREAGSLDVAMNEFMPLVWQIGWLEGNNRYLREKLRGTVSEKVMVDAQIAGGGGGGLMNQIITWVVTNIATGVIAAGVLLVGGLLIAGRHSLEAVIVMVIGGLVIANWQTIAGMFGV